MENINTMNFSPNNSNNSNNERNSIRFAIGSYTNAMELLQNVINTCETHDSILSIDWQIAYLERCFRLMNKIVSYLSTLKNSNGNDYYNEIGDNPKNNNQFWQKQLNWRKSTLMVLLIVCKLQIRKQQDQNNNNSNSNNRKHGSSYFENVDKFWNLGLAYVKYVGMIENNQISTHCRKLVSKQQSSKYDFEMREILIQLWQEFDVNPNKINWNYLNLNMEYVIDTALTGHQSFNSVLNNNNYNNHNNNTNSNNNNNGNNSQSIEKYIYSCRQESTSKKTIVSTLCLMIESVCICEYLLQNKKYDSLCDIINPVVANNNNIITNNFNFENYNNDNTGSFNSNSNSNSINLIQNWNEINDNLAKYEKLIVKMNDRKVLLLISLALKRVPSVAHAIFDLIKEFAKTIEKKKNNNNNNNIETNDKISGSKFHIATQLIRLIMTMSKCIITCVKIWNMIDFETISLAKGQSTRNRLFDCCVTMGCALGDYNVRFIDFANENEFAIAADVSFDYVLNLANIAQNYVKSINDKRFYFNFATKLRNIFFILVFSLLFSEWFCSHE